MILNIIYILYIIFAQWSGGIPVSKALNFNAGGS